MPRRSASEVDLGRIDAGVDRAAHQHHRMRHVRIAVGFHARDRGQHRHRRLAHRDDVHVAAEEMQHRDQVVDVVVEIERPFRHRHHARVDPFGDVDVVIGQEAFDRAAQQRRVVARHRRDDEQLRLRPPQRMLERALEMQQAAERPLPDRRDVHRHALGADQRRGDVPLRLAVAAGRALEQFAGGGDGLAELGVRPGIGGVLEEQLAGIGKGAGRIERGLAHFVEPIGRRRVHRAERRANESGQAVRRGCCAAEFPNRHGPSPQRFILQCSRLSFFGHKVNPSGECLRSPEKDGDFPLNYQGVAIRRTAAGSRSGGRCGAAPGTPPPQLRNRRG